MTTLPGSETAAVEPTPNGTTSQLTTESTDALKKSLRRLLLDYATPDGDTARDLLGEALYIDRAPDERPFPYAVLRLATTSAGQGHGMRLDGTLEVQVHGRPFAMRPSVEAVCDLFDRCMLSRTLTRDGLVFSHAASRQLLPPGPSAIDSEVVTVVLSYSLIVYPAYLTSLTLQPLPSP